MREKIAFASWNYIKLVCAEHREELVLGVIKGRPFYECTVQGCLTKISTAVYEKALDDVIALQNKGELTTGVKWKRKSDSRVVEFTLSSCSNGKRPEVSVRVF